MYVGTYLFLDPWDFLIRRDHNTFELHFIWEKKRQHKHNHQYRTFDPSHYSINSFNEKDFVFFSELLWPVFGKLERSKTKLWFDKKMIFDISYDIYDVWQFSSNAIYCCSSTKETQDRLENNRQILETQWRWSFPGQTVWETLYVRRGKRRTWRTSSY